MAKVVKEWKMNCRVFHSLLKTSKLIVLFSIFLFPSLMEAQEKDEMVLEAVEDWRSELLTFPLDFASSLPYSGVEDIRFAPGWANEKSEEFWSYILVWCINEDPTLTEEKLNKEMQVYFNGLAKAIAQSKNINSDVLTPTLSNLSKGKTIKKGEYYIGQVNIHDAFFTKRPIKLNFIVESYKSDSDKYIVLFRVSPQTFSHQIWDKLNAIKVLPSYQ